MRVAYYSPMPPSRSGIADYSALLVPALGRLVDLEVVSRPQRAPRGCDARLYHVGNNPEAHGWIVEALERAPGLVVLHEHVLHHLVAGMTVAAGDPDGYLQAMQRDSGVVGRLLAHGIIDGIVPPVWETRPEDFPLCGGVLDAATGLIVHSRTVEAAARGRGYDGPIHRIPHPAWPRPDVAVDPSVVDVQGPVFGAFGHLNATKRTPELLEAFARVADQVPGARLLIVGSAAEDLLIDARIAELEVAHPGSVVRIDYVEEPRLWSLIAGCDACVCLRSPTMGETSGIAIRALVCGKPLIVSDVGWFSELPDAIAAKVPVDGTEVGTLAAAMVDLARDPERCDAMGRAAEVAARAMGVDHVAELYRRALVEVAGGPAVRDRLTAEIADAATGVARPDDQLVPLIAARLREVGL